MDIYFIEKMTCCQKYSEQKLLMINNLNDISNTNYIYNDNNKYKIYIDNKVRITIDRDKFIDYYDINFGSFRIINKLEIKCKNCINKDLNKDLNKLFIDINNRLQ